MRSGELARLSGVSADSLRHYERLGILPKPPRDFAMANNGGYRNYPSSSVARVRLIRSSLSIGFSLPELAAVLKLRDGGEFPCDQVRKIAGVKLEQLRAQLKELTRMRRQLEGILSTWDSKLARTRNGKPARLLEALPQVPKRNIATLKYAETRYRASGRVISRAKPNL
jgi:MerR family transcriptional regulator, mercuric resistance operon regulatory protein